MSDVSIEREWEAIANGLSMVLSEEASHFALTREQAVEVKEALRLAVRVCAWADAFEAETKALPLGHEERSRGASSYNWRMTFVRELRSSLRTEAEAA